MSSFASVLARSPRLAPSRRSPTAPRRPARWRPSAFAAGAHTTTTDADDDAGFRMEVIARRPDAHSGAVLALAAVDPIHPDALPTLVSSSMDRTVATWHLEPDDDDVREEDHDDDGESLARVRFRRDVQFGPDDAPWWCLDVDEDYLYAGTHARTVVARVAADPDLPPLPGAVENHTGWVRALASAPKTSREIAADPDAGDRWRFSAACNVIRVWHDVFRDEEDASSPSDEDEDEDEDEDASESETESGSDSESESGSETSALEDVGSASIFTGDVLSLASSRGRLFAGVADGTVRGWTLENIPKISLSDTVDDRRPTDRAATRTPTLAAMAASPTMDGRVSALHATRDGRWVVAGDASGALAVFPASDLSDNSEVSTRVRDAHRGRVRALCEGPGGTVCSAGEDGVLRAWRVGVDVGAETTSDKKEMSDKKPPRVTLASETRVGVDARAVREVRRRGEVEGVVVGDAEGGLWLVVTATR